MVTQIEESKLSIIFNKFFLFIKKLIAYLFSILFILLSFVEFSDSIISGACLLIASLILFPPFIKYYEKKFNFNMNSGLRILIVFVLFCLAIAMSSDNMASGKLINLEDEIKEKNINDKFTNFCARQEINRMVKIECNSVCHQVYFYGGEETLNNYINEKN
jgi:predicted PurR-regulated permease PerM